MALTQEDKEQILENAANNYDGDLNLSIAAFLTSPNIVKRCGFKIPPSVDLSELDAMKAEIETPATTAAKPLQIIKESFSNDDLLEVIEQAKQNNRAIKTQVAVAIYGENVLIEEGKISPDADKFRIGRTLGRITILQNREKKESIQDPIAENSDAEEIDSSNAENSDAGSNENQTDSKDSIATEEPKTEASEGAQEIEQK